MKKRPSVFLAMALILWVCAPVAAKVDLVILPERDKTQLTIYNSADLALVREQRSLSFKEGLNRLQFSWANTLIDPTSLEMVPAARADAIDVMDVIFPPRTRNAGVWRIRSETSGNVPVELSYLTSGLSWRAFYMGVLSPDEKTMRLEGYVRVTNGSGEDYENARVRLVVGRIHLLDRIADLARREHPYGRPGPSPRPVPRAEAPAPAKAGLRMLMEDAVGFAAARPKEILKEGLSEYFLYTIEGTETIPDGWSKRLPSFQVDEVPVVNLYRFEEERYGDRPVRFLSFRNDAEHRLGETPVPGGGLKVYRKVDDGGLLAYEGRSDFKYIPVGEDVELNLGAVADVVVEPVLMDYRTEGYLFDEKGRITGWNEIRRYEVEVKNTRPVPVKVDVRRNIDAPSWEMEKGGEFDSFEQVDRDTVKFLLDVGERKSRKFHYSLTIHHGKRAD